MRSRGSSALAIGVAVIAAVAVAPGTGTARPVAGRTASVQTLAPGVTLTRTTDPAERVRGYVLTIDPASAATIDVATPNGAMGSYATPSDIGAGHEALAAINGDFTVYPGRPLHPLAVDGSLKQLGMQRGVSFGISQDKTNPFLDYDSATVTGRRLASGGSFAVSKYNTGDPFGSGIVAYSPYGGSAVRPREHACSVRLVTPGPMHWGPRGEGVSRDWVVHRSVCTAKPVQVLRRSIVLSSHLTGAGSRTLRAMKPGDRVRLSWSFGWAGVMDTVGGMPMLVAHGTPVAPARCSSYFCSKNPRTGIGITEDGHILLVVVDGRSNDSSGLTLLGFARYMVSLGATYALNLDGGGGSAMWVAGQGSVNQPSDGSQRPVTSAVLVLPGLDPGEGWPLGYARSSATEGMAGRGLTSALVSALRGRRAMDAALADAGSTGGLMDALIAGGLGDTVAAGAYPGSFVEMARTYRALRR